MEAERERQRERERQIEREGVICVHNPMISSVREDLRGRKER